MTVKRTPPSRTPRVASPLALLLLCAPLAPVLATGAQTAHHSTQTSTAPSTQTSTAPSGKHLAPADGAALQQALQAYDAGRLAEAEPVLVHLAARYPSNATIQTAAGMAMFESGSIAQGTPYLQRAHRLDSRNASVTENLGIALLHLQRPEEALPLLQESSRLDPENATARLGIAQALMALKRFNEAADNFEKAMQHTPPSDNSGDVRHDWALALFNANRAQQAVDVLQSTPDTDRNAPAQELLGEAEEKLGHFQPAFSHFKRAAELDPTETNLLAYGNELLQHWTFPAAIEIFRYAHTRYPSSDRLSTGLGIAYFGNNDFAHAAEIFHAQLAAQPGNPAAADMLGRSCSAQVSTAVQGCADLISFAEAHPKNASASLYAAIALLHNAANPADSDRAESLLKQALASDPRLPEAWYQTAVLQQQRNQWAESTVSLQRVLELRPSYPEAHYRLARAFGHTGRKAEAQQEIALQQKSAQSAKDADTRRMQEVMTFLTPAN